MQDTVQQLRTAIRDQRALSAALELDQATDTEFRNMINNVLESIEHIASNDGLWDQLTEAAGQPLNVEWAHIDQVATSTLPYLLTACGYHSPPPPPVGELSDDFVVALASATTVAPDARPELVGQARNRIRVLTDRIRQQISRPVPAPVRRKLLRRWARRACAVARAVIVPVACAVVPALLPLIPGVGPAVLILGTAATPLITLGANALIGWVEGRLQDPEPQRPEWANDATMETKHLTAILNRIDRLVDLKPAILGPLETGHIVDPAAQATYSEIVGEISAHAVRINDLVNAREARDPFLAAESATLVQAAKALQDPATLTGGLRHFDAVLDHLYQSNQSVAGRL